MEKLIVKGVNSDDKMKLRLHVEYKNDGPAAVGNETDEQGPRQINTLEWKDFYSSPGVSQALSIHLSPLFRREI